MVSVICTRAQAGQKTRSRGKRRSSHSETGALAGKELARGIFPREIMCSRRVPRHERHSINAFMTHFPGDLKERGHFFPRYNISNIGDLMRIALISRGFWQEHEDVGGEGGTAEQ